MEHVDEQPANGIADIIRGAAALHGANVPGATGVHFCGGRFDDKHVPCSAPVVARGGFCTACADFNSRKLRAQMLKHARASVPNDPGVRFDSELFQTVTSSEPLRERIAKAGREWRSIGADGKPTSLALLGSTGVCKTFVALAIANRILEQAESPALSMPMFERARGLRWAKARDLLQAARAHKLGAGLPPAIEEATRAQILVLDELGFEHRPRDGEPDLLFELLDSRYTARRTTIVTSGRSVVGLAIRYGEAFKRRITDRATVVEAFRPTDPELVTK